MHHVLAKNASEREGEYTGGAVIDGPVVREYLLGTDQNLQPLTKPRRRAAHRASDFDVRWLGGEPKKNGEVDRMKTK
jgi:hypothetical protein